MKPSDVKPITYMKTHSAELVAAVNEQRSPIVITQNGEPRAVVMDVQSYERLQNSLALLKIIAQSEADFKAGRCISQEELDGRIAKRFRD
jgi:prevent-host-death family protein